MGPQTPESLQRYKVKRAQLFQVDAFTNQPFKGNPAAVCLLFEPREAEWMQQIAAEMSLSETAFLLQEEGFYHLRWFTPLTEVDLCGHATLASAHVLWEEGHLPPNQAAQFKTRSGLLTASRKEDLVLLDFPAEPEMPADPPLDLCCALGVMPRYVGKNRFDYLVELDSEEMLLDLKPDFRLLASIEMRGVMVTCRASSLEYDFVSRFFAPRSGIDEDPVTGSAHCCLGPFWRKRLNKDQLLGYQVSARGGLVQVRVGGDRVFLGGEAITIFRGELESFSK